MIDLTNWKWTAPINSKGIVSGTGDAMEVLKLDGYSKPPYFTPNADGSITFMAPTDGARTSGSKYPRSELRQMKNGTEFEWTVEQGGRLDATLAVNELPKTVEGKPGRIVIGQIHGPDDELCRLYYDLGRLYFYDDKAGSSPKETQFILKDASGKEPNILINDRFSYSIVATRSALTVHAVHNGVTYVAVDLISKFWPGKPCYFKAGVYVQVSKPGSGAGTIGTGQGKATFYDIALEGASPQPIPETPPAPSPIDTTGLRYNGKSVVRIEMQPVAVFADGSKVLL